VSFVILGINDSIALSKFEALAVFSSKVSFVNINCTKVFFIIITSMYVGATVGMEEGSEDGLCDIDGERLGVTVGMVDGTIDIDGKELGTSEGLKLGIDEGRIVIVGIPDGILEPDGCEVGNTEGWSDNVGLSDGCSEGIEVGN
jgi:hypothetical protein